MAIRKSTSAQILTVVDVEGLDAANPQAAVKTFELKGRPKVVRCDVFIAGGGMGGLAAAIRAAAIGQRVCVVEETSWLGGQLTAQGVSALDENHLVETTGATRTYQQMRTLIRNHYRTRAGATQKAVADHLLNPGDCWVSRLSFEPHVALAAIKQLISESGGAHNLMVSVREKVVGLKLDDRRVKSALVVNLDNGKFVEYRARYFLDATELGDLLPLAGVPYASGAESKAETGEPHAPERANPENVQDFTYPFVLELKPGNTKVISKPADYEEFFKAGKFSFCGYKMFTNAPAPKSESKFEAFPKQEYLPFWTYRRLVAADKFKSSAGDLSMINWMSNDLRGENIIDQAPDVQAKRLARAKNLSLGFLYWLQTAAPRDEGGTGYPELVLRCDVLGTTDGLSKYPYIRESRRIKAKQTIVEQDIAAATNKTARARIFRDSVGIGFYPIDIHGEQDVPGAQQASLPFQIPLGALVQESVSNLIPACKNIGTTHVTNGAYRLHPVEWAIGEAAGTLAAFCIEHRTSPQRVLRNKAKIAALQKQLVAGGAPVYWYDDVPTIHPDFEAIQMAAALGIMTGNADSLSFRPDDPADNGQTRAERAVALYKQLVKNLARVSL